MDWYVAKLESPPEIINFLQEIFEIVEIRGKVGEEAGIVFIIHTDEKNHFISHVHAEYSEYNISIEISDKAKILAGNLPKKKEKIARAWVVKNKERLLHEWSTKSISAKSRQTITKLRKEVE